MEFYNQLCEDYDSMTRFDERMKKERHVFESLINEFEFKQVLDAGCGSGFCSILLSRLGLEVTGIDASIKMIQLAKSNALRYQTSADFIRADFATFLRDVNTKFDSIFCLGNALAHLLNRNELDTAIDNFYQVLELDGYIIIQLLNYSKILKEKQRIVGITECENKIFIRFYDFHDTLVQFNILTVIRERGGFSHQWVSTPQYPWCIDDLRPSLRSHGFKKIQIFSDLARNEFDEDSSQNLVVFAQ